jgi:hypothetical protein
MVFHQRNPRIEIPRHLIFIRSLPCLFTGREAEAAHVRYGEPKLGKPKSGVSEKPSDYWTIPLCPEMHRTGKDSQHESGNERRWWINRGVDPLPICMALYLCYVRGDRAVAMTIILENRP